MAMSLLQVVFSAMLLLQGLAAAFSCYESSAQTGGAVIDCQQMTLCYFRVKIANDGISETSWRRYCALASAENKPYVNQVVEWTEQQITVAAPTIVEYYCDSESCNKRKDGIL
jgi:hypothetical protein